MAGIKEKWIAEELQARTQALAGVQYDLPVFRRSLPSPCFHHVTFY